MRAQITIVFIIVVAITSAFISVYLFRQAMVSDKDVLSDQEVINIEGTTPGLQPIDGTPQEPELYIPEVVNQANPATPVNQLDQAILTQILSASASYNGILNNLTFFFVPMNYPSNNPDFLSRVVDAVKILQQGGIISDLSQVVIVPETYVHNGPTHPGVDCLKEVHPTKVLRHVSSWHQKNFRPELPGGNLSSNILGFKYRVIGIDSWVQDVSRCGCGFSPEVYDPAIYIGGAQCGRSAETIPHEVGHTFGLCDEYDTCTWNDWNNIWLAAKGGCKNNKPLKSDSDCYDTSIYSSIRPRGSSAGCCSQDRACCQGKFSTRPSLSDTPAFNVMGAVGSASVDYQISEEFKDIERVYEGCFVRSDVQQCLKISKKVGP